MRNPIKRAEVRNLGALTSIQVSNALVPLLIVPFALSMLGTTAYAEVAITEALSAIALAVVLFSFEVDGVASVTQLGEDAEPKSLSMILSSIVVTRLLLLGAVTPILLTAYWLAGGQSVYLLALWLLIPLGHVFFCYWFYQAFEQNVPVAIITLSSRVVTVAIILIFVRGPEDAFLIPLAIGGPFTAGGIFSFLYLMRTRRLRLYPVGIKTIASNLKRGKEIFAGNVAVTLYREMNVVILGIAGASAASISTYALVEKFIKMLQAGTRPLNQLFFPKVLRALKDETGPTPATARLIAKFAIPQILAVIGLVGAIMAAYPVLTSFVPQIAQFGEFPNVMTLAIIMIPATLFGMANFMFGTAGLNYLNSRGYFFLAILVTGLASAVFCFVLANWLGAVGAAICFVGAEAMLFGLVIARYVRPLRSSGGDGIGTRIS